LGWHEARALKLAAGLGLVCCVALALTSFEVADCRENAIDVLVMGATAPWLNPIQSWGKAEPALDLTLIPSTVPVGGLATPQIESGRRAMRIYFPRTYGQLIEREFMVYEHMFMEFFTPAQMEDMHRAILEEGLGGFVTIGGVTHTSVEPNYPWIESKLNDAFPSLASVEIFEKWRQYGAHPGRVVINEDANLPPVLTMLLHLGLDGIRQQVIYYMAAKEGAKTWARSVDSFENPPFLISWTYGQGETWANSIGMGYAWWHLRDPNLGGNPFALDVFMNMLYFSTGRELPTDISKVHAAREGLMAFEESKEWVLSLMDFADRFGANVARAVEDLGRIDQAREDAVQAYLEQDLDRTLELLVLAKDLVDEAAEEAIELKDRALLWTYVIEWFATLGVLMVSGQVLYFLMVRRMLYRTVGSTRTGRAR
jgi:hypothetical protein